MQLPILPITVAVTLLMAGVAGNRPALATGPERHALHIGVVMPVTGPQSAFGAEALKGLELALDDLRTSDPVQAAKVRILPGDDTSSASGATAAAKTLIDQQRVHALVGSVTSASTLATVQEARAKKLAVISPYASDITIATDDVVFTNALTVALQAAALGEYLVTQMQVKSPALLHDGSAGSQAFAAAFRTAVTAAGGQTGVEALFEPGSTDFKAQFAALAKAKVNWVVTPASWQEGAAMISQGAAQIKGLHMVGTDRWDTRHFIKALSESTGAAPGIPEGHYFVAGFSDDDPREEVTGFMTRFKAKYGRNPGTIAAHAYDSFGLLLAALKNAGNNQRTALIGGLRKVSSWPGVTGHISFDTENRLSRDMSLRVVTRSGPVFKARIAPKSMVTNAGAVTPAVKGH